MEQFNLQKIFDENKNRYDGWFQKYKETVSKFIDNIKSDIQWTDDDKRQLVFAQNNYIANNGQGKISNSEFEQLMSRWEDLLLIIKSIVEHNDISENQFNEFRYIFTSCCKKNKVLAANRVLAAFLPNVLTTTVYEKDFDYVEKNLRRYCADYDIPSSKLWSERNKYFIKYCNEKVKFDDPWQSSIFHWMLHDYFKNKQDTTNMNEMNTNETLLERYKTLLQSTHNLILTGAPGTGKTYLAKQIAQQLIFGAVKDKMSEEEQKQFNEQCVFVQYHPSYDYTDFVEGLRPIQDDNGNVGFERKDGVFKAFCAKAISSLRTNTVDNFDEVWDKLVDKLNEDDFIDVPFISNKTKSFKVELNEYGTGLANRTYQNDDFIKGEWVKGQSKFFSKDQLYNIYKGLPGVPSGGHDNYRRAIVEELKLKYGLKPYKEGSTVSHPDKKFVFIIDEINRGEISKIFGELFFSIDPGYRGTKGDVRTQYANMVKMPNVFDNELHITDPLNYGHFFVPENVYIIGTMNDIDRSVESMDFAFRRRFAFKEVSAEESKEMLKSDEAWGYDEQNNSKKPKDDVIDSIIGNKEKGIIGKMDAVNNVIWHQPIEGEKDEAKSIDGLSSAYHIGASYFLKLANYKNADGSFDFDQLWEYHLEGLLFEYLRGTTDIPKKIKRLAIAYGYTKVDKYE